MIFPMKARKFDVKFTDSFPLHLKEGILYVSIKHRVVSHLCACGCSSIIDTPISPDGWRITYNGDTISLYPSIGNWHLVCHSHYYITDSIAIPLFNDNILYGKRKEFKHKKYKWLHNSEHTHPQNEI